jgi:hypothetical protein
VTRREGFKPATRVIVLASSAAQHVEIVLESEAALTLPISVSGFRPQNSEFANFDC